MRCANCPGTLEESDFAGLICVSCSLLHDPDGQPEGWLVAAHRTPGGVVPWSSLQPFAKEHSLSSRRIRWPSSIFRAAIEVGLRQPDEVQRLLDEETLQIAIDRQIERFEVESGD